MSLFDWLRTKRKPKLEAPLAKAGEANSDPEPEPTEAAATAPNRPLLYVFQFVALPEAAFQNHPELIREFEGERSFMPLLHFRSKALVRCIGAGLVPEGHEENDAAMAADQELFETVAVHPYKRNGYTVHVVSMPTPEFVPEAHFAAIAYKDDEPKQYGSPSPSTRYFTLEKSETRLPLLCEVRADGSRKNYGEGPAPDMEAFVEAVFERLGSNRVLLDSDCAMVMMFAPPSSTDYHLVNIEFEDGTRLEDAKVFRMCELELPPEFIGREIKGFGVNAHQP